MAPISCYKYPLKENCYSHNTWQTRAYNKFNELSVFILCRPVVEKGFQKWSLKFSLNVYGQDISYTFQENLCKHT